ncbi:MAG: hypothetical protein H0T85_00885, partial [Geodermatophilaceae bacterium]|nr:hypothetical protein [Geodermatophilaceae bacterium]
TWSNPPTGSFVQTAQLPVPEVDTAFPCGGSGRPASPSPPWPRRSTSCPTESDRPGGWPTATSATESLVTNQSVEARPGVAGVRWYEIGNLPAPVVFQASTYAPNDGVNRWMGSIAQDRRGNMALGYSVSNATTVSPASAAQAAWPATR